MVDGREGIDGPRETCKEVGLKDNLHAFGLLILQCTGRWVCLQSPVTGGCLARDGETKERERKR
jgi:hypothetical protein